MKAFDIISIIISALVLLYPLYDTIFITNEKYKIKNLWYVYFPLALLSVFFIAWTTINQNLQFKMFLERLVNQEKLSREIYSFEIRTRYKFEYDKEIPQIQITKKNPIKMYFLNSRSASNKIEDLEGYKDKVVFINDFPRVQFPDNHTIEFVFKFTPENPSELYGNPLNYLCKYDKFTFPWGSFIHFLAFTNMNKSSPNNIKTDPQLYIQMIINGRVYVDQGINLNKFYVKDSPNLVYTDYIVITDPLFFKNIEKEILK